MASAVLLVLLDSIDEAQADELSTWCLKNVFPEALTSRRFVSATLYHRSDIGILPEVPAPPQRFYAIYQMDASTPEELEEAAQHVRDRLASGAMEMSPALDPSVFQSAFLLPIGTV